MSNNDIPSDRPYLVRAIFDWCVDSGFTPFLTVADSPACVFPKQHVVAGLMTLNISPRAAPNCKIGPVWIEVTTRFSGVATDMIFPVSRVVAIYARENGRGVNFDPEDDPEPEKPKDGPSAVGKVGHLRVVK
ncbi:MULTISPECIES: stringent starvation protein B [Candidatus Ichthyocystis]|uniref:Stringent starvation protein B n=1 Tax=Candidatus Ichthyocystis hellenicum TaxID=1561003 RepID=A0A0S4M331_9BURK|nr:MULTISPECIES: ClpXP protease specificity-enhancing factor SspB [Ichthyocystis]CUT17146.1 Stringent starvation protein B [Candidatus Ichthyocystis hellenicum]